MRFMVSSICLTRASNRLFSAASRAKSQKRVSAGSSGAIPLLRASAKRSRGSATIRSGSGTGSKGSGSLNMFLLHFLENGFRHLPAVVDRAQNDLVHRAARDQEIVGGGHGLAGAVDARPRLQVVLEAPAERVEQAVAGAREVLALARHLDLGEQDAIGLGEPFARPGAGVPAHPAVGPTGALAGAGAGLDVGGEAAIDHGGLVGRQVLQPLFEQALF